MISPSIRFTHDVLLPAIDPDKARIQPVRLVPSTTFLRGQTLGPIASTANDVQTFTATGTPAAGSFIYAVTNPLTGVVANLAIPFNATSTALQTLATPIFGLGNITAGGGPWPGTPLTLTGAGASAGVPIPVAVAGLNALTGGSVPASSVAHTTTGVNKGDMAIYSSTVVAAPTVAPTVAASGAGGSFGAGTYPVVFSYVNGQGETTASPPSVVTLTAAQGIQVTAITGIPAGVTSVDVYVAGVFTQALTVTTNATTTTVIVGYAASVWQTPPKQNTAFSAPNGVGTQVAKCLLQSACMTDAFGHVVTSGQVGGSFHGGGSQTASAYFTGTFDVTQTSGLDAAAVAQLGRIIRGDLTSGLIELS
jgi:hypothetical protein